MLCYNYIISVVNESPCRVCPSQKTRFVAKTDDLLIRHTLLLKCLISQPAFLKLSPLVAMVHSNVCSAMQFVPPYQSASQMSLSVAETFLLCSKYLKKKCSVIQYSNNAHSVGCSSWASEVWFSSISFNSVEAYFVLNHTTIIFLPATSPFIKNLLAHVLLSQSV